MRNALQVWIGSLSLLVMAITGCGPGGPPTYPVTGMVTFEGKPIPDGQIIFFPTEEGLTPDAGPIKDGKFSFVAREGEKRVQIEATREVPGKTIPQPPPLTGTIPVTEMYIPEVYNSKSKLRVTVTDSAPDNQFDFDLTADGSGSGS